MTHKEVHMAQTRFKRISSRVIAMTVAVAALLVLFNPMGIPSVSAQTREVTVILDWLPQGHHSAYFVARADGSYKKAGLDVTVQDGKGSGLSVKMVAGGAITFGLAAVPAIIQGIAKGAPIVIVANITKALGNGVMVRSDSMIKSPKDLEGKMYSASPYSINYTLFPGYLKKAGVDITKVTITTGDAAQLNSLLALKKIDATGALAWEGPIVFQDTFGTSARFLAYSDVGLEQLGYCLIVSKETLKDSPDLVKGFVQATLKAHSWSAQHPDEAIDLMTQQFKGRDLGSKKVMAATLAAFSKGYTHPKTKGKPIGWISEELLKETISSMQENGQLKSTPPDIKSIYTNEFVGK